MSVIINGSGQYLQATLANPASETEHKLVTMWALWDEAQTPQVQNYLFQLQNPSGTAYLSARSNSDGGVFFYGKHGGTEQFPGQLGALPHGNWRLFGGYMPANGSSALMRGYRRNLDGSVSQTNATVAMTSVANDGRTYSDFWIGRYPTDASRRWRGKIAEVAIWTVTNRDQADAIFAELANGSPAANTISAGTPIWYAPLRTGTVATIGTSPVAFGSLTYDDADHPVGGTTAVPGVRIRLYSDATPQASLTGLMARWWDNSTATGTPIYETNTATTSSLGWLELDLSATTSLSVGGVGHLKLYKAGATADADLHFSSRITVANLAQ